MTPQPAPQFKVAAGSDVRDMHLTEDQFGELLARPAARCADCGASSAEAHLLRCERCAAELASLRESLSLFRQASTAYADNELRRLPQMTLPARRPLLFPALEPALLATAAALCLAALLPMQTLRPHALPPAPAASASVAHAPAESDEALLDDVNREISAAVPAPMQALADPTATISDQTSAQRKD